MLDSLPGCGPVRDLLQIDTSLAAQQGESSSRCARRPGFASSTARCPNEPCLAHPDAPDGLCRSTKHLLMFLSAKREPPNGCIMLERCVQAPK